MRDDVPGDEEMKTDLLKQMLSANAVCPVSVPVESIIEDWFGHHERNVARQLISDLLDDQQSPLQYADDEETEVCLESRDSALDSISQTDPWYTT